MAKKNSGFLKGTLFGAAVAGIAALLYAPKSGKELRKDLNQQANMAKDSAKDYVDIAKEKGTELKQTAQKAGSEYMETMKQTTEKVKQDLSGTAGDLKETYKESMDKEKEIAKGAAEDAKSTMQDGAQSAKKDKLTEDRKYTSSTLKDDVERRTMDYAYDEEKAGESLEEQYNPANVSSEQTPSDTDVDDKKTTNTNVGI